MTSTSSESRTFPFIVKSHFTKQLLTLISVDLECFPTLKSDIHLDLAALVNLTFSGR